MEFPKKRAEEKDLDINPFAEEEVSSEEQQAISEQLKREVGFPQKEVSEEETAPLTFGAGQEESEETFPEAEESTEAPEPYAAEAPFAPGKEYAPPSEGEEPPSDFIPPFPPPPELIASAAPSNEDVQNIAKSISEGMRQELEAKIKALEEDISELKKLDSEISSVATTLESIEEKYAKLEEKTGTLAPEIEADITDIRTQVNNIYQILSTALPALITKVQELSKKRK